MSPSDGFVVGLIAYINCPPWRLLINQAGAITMNLPKKSGT